MIVTIKHDDGKTESFRDVTDCYIAVRQLKPMQDKNATLAVLPEARSWSWGANLRELLKELRQSVVEIEDVLKGLQRGGSS